MNINIYHQFDPTSTSSGGIGKFVLNLIKEAPMEWDITLICLSKFKAGTKTIILINGRAVKCVYVLSLDDENTRRVFPITFRYILGLFKYRHSIPRADVHFMQRIEYCIFTTLYYKNESKCVLFHNDYVSILDKSKSESYLSYFPKLYMKFVGFFSKKIQSILTVNLKTKELIDSYVGNDIVKLIPTWPDRRIFNVKEHSIKVDFINDFISSYPYLKDKKIILFVGRLQAQKDPKLALDFIAQIDCCYHLLVAGDGNLKEHLLEYSKQISIQERVTFLGNIAQEKLVQLYNFSDFYLSTSHFEGMSVALLEALSCGLPSLTTQTGDSINVIKDGVNGIVCAEHSLEQLCCAFNKINDVEFDPKVVSKSIENYSVKPLIEQLSSLKPINMS